MPFSRAWSDLNPLGTAAASSIDDEIRNVRVDVHERMDVLVPGKWATDPIVLSGSKLIVPVTAGVPTDTAGGNISFSNPNKAIGLSAVSPSSMQLTIPIAIPPGCTITQLLAYINLSGVGIQTSVSLRKTDLTTGALSTVSTSPSVNVGGAAILDTGVIAEVMPDLYAYIATIDGITSVNGISLSIFGIKVVYTKPNLL